MTDVSQDARGAAADLWKSMKRAFFKNATADHDSIAIDYIADPAFAGFEAHIRNTIAARDAEAMRLLREARRWMPAKGTAHADPDCYDLCAEIDTLTSAAQDGLGDGKVVT